MQARLQTIGMVALGLLVWALCCAGPATAADPVGEIIRQRGSVSISRDGRAFPAQVGSMVREADVVVTGDTGRVRIRFVDGTVFTLGQRSAFRVAEYGFDADAGDRDVRLTALNGIFGATVAAVAGTPSFDIELMSSVASVRSTSLMFDVTSMRCEIFVEEGRVIVAHKAGAYESIELVDGEGTDVMPDTPPTPAKMWGTARVDAFRTRLAM